MHLLLCLVKGNTHGFEATFRVIAYSQAAQVWGIIPVVGSFIGWFWRAVIQVIGLKETHQISYGKIFFAFLIPFILFAVIALAVVLFLIIKL